MGWQSSELHLLNRLLELLTSEAGTDGLEAEKIVEEEDGEEGDEEQDESRQSKVGWRHSYF